MSPFKIGFEANPTGGPGIFLTRLRTALEESGHFDAAHPDAWIQLCYAPMPEAIMQNAAVRKVIRVDGVYSYRHRLLPVPLPGVDDWLSRRGNRKRNRPIVRNLALADEIVYQSEFSRQATWKFITPTPPGAVIFNGVDTRQFAPPSPRIRDDRLVNILISHSYRPHKRLHEAMRIIAELKRRDAARRWHLHVAGGDDGLSIPYAQQVMQAEGLGPDVVTFYGKLPYDHLFELYGRCDFVLGLSFWDFCPNVIVEALACGLPVLGVDFGGIPELTGEAGRLVKEEIAFDYQDLYDFKALPRVNAGQYVDEALCLLDRLAEYQHLARERAVRELDIRVTARRYLDACQAASQSVPS